MKSVIYSIVKAVAICLVLQGAFSSMIIRAQTPPRLPDENAVSLPQGTVGVEYRRQFLIERRNRNSSRQSRHI